jgi:hypothetical protein
MEKKTTECLDEVVLSLIESAKFNGHDPWAYLKDVFERLPALKNRDLELLLPHNWKPAGVPVALADGSATDTGTGTGTGTHSPAT